MSSSEEDWASSQIDWTPPQTTKDQDMFDLLKRLQGSCLNDQRCIIPGGYTATDWSLSCVAAHLTPWLLSSLKVVSGVTFRTNTPMTIPLVLRVTQ